MTNGVQCQNEIFEIQDQGQSLQVLYIESKVLNSSTTATNELFFPPCISWPYRNRTAYFSGLFNVRHCSTSPTSCDRIYLISPLKFSSTGILVPSRDNSPRALPCNRVHNVYPYPCWCSAPIRWLKSSGPIRRCSFPNEPVSKARIDFRSEQFRAAKYQTDVSIKYRVT